LPSSKKPLLIAALTACPVARHLYSLLLLLLAQEQETFTHCCSYCLPSSKIPLLIAALTACPGARYLYSLLLLLLAQQQETFTHCCSYCLPSSKKPLLIAALTACPAARNLYSLLLLLLAQQQETYFHRLIPLTMKAPLPVRVVCCRCTAHEVIPFVREAVHGLKAHACFYPSLLAIDSLIK